MKKINMMLVALLLYMSSNANKMIESDCSKPELHIFNFTSYNVEDLINWTCEYLDIEDVFIRVDFLPAYYEEKGIVFEIYDRSYQIGLKRYLSNWQLILIHELIHIKQFESGDLEVVDNTKVSYKSKIIDLEYVDYRFRKYENEAHALDDLILIEYKRHLRKQRHHNEKEIQSL